ncbi:MAG: DUF1444 family protein [Gemmataceae bacterium]
MSSTTLKQFQHPAGVYRLEYPSHWEVVQQDESRSCGFGPHERDDVGLWISILPMSVDTERMFDDLPKLIESMPKIEAGEFKRDESLRGFALKADVLREGQAGHYWLLAGGDVILFASSQVPGAERDVWNPPFEKLIASLHITRDEELQLRRLSIEVLEKLRAKYPDEDFKLDERGIRGNHQVVFLSNLWREIQGAPKRRDKIVDHFVNSITPAAGLNMGEETWEDAQRRVIPILKPVEYFRSGGPAQHQLRIDWVGDVMICYALRSKKLFRFVTDWDVRRWETDNDTLHKIALENLARLPWPDKLEGSRHPDGGRVIVVDSGDSLASSRLLHPELHKLFSQALGSPFLAGIPDRDTLVLFSNRKILKQRIGRRLLKDHHSSAYPITARPFLVTADGIAPG